MGLGNNNTGKNKTSFLVVCFTLGTSTEAVGEGVEGGKGGMESVVCVARFSVCQCLAYIRCRLTTLLSLFCSPPSKLTGGSPVRHSLNRHSPLVAPPLPPSPRTQIFSHWDCTSSPIEKKIHLAQEIASRARLSKTCFFLSFLLFRYCRLLSIIQVDPSAGLYPIPPWNSRPSAVLLLCALFFFLFFLIISSRPDSLALSITTTSSSLSLSASSSYLSCWDCFTSRRLYLRPTEPSTQKLGLSSICCHSVTSLPVASIQLQGLPPCLPEKWRNLMLAHLCRGWKQFLKNWP